VTSLPPAAPLADAVADALGDGGPLAAGDAAWRARTAQLEMALAVARALEERSTLVVEAGTGVGKTFAYLVPLLLAGRRALVSTATKSLQDQLFLRDLPRLVQRLAVPARLALLKGRGAYLCLHRLGLARREAQLPDRFAVRQLARVEQWARATRAGDLAEVEGLDDRSPVIPLVTSTRENCLGSDCPSFRDCHVVRARREAMAADLVVVNHHLFFADLALRDSGVAELLPTVDAAVFDEAHQLAEAGLPFLGRLLATGQLIDFGRDQLAAGLRDARGLAPWQELHAAIERAARELRLAAAGLPGDAEPAAPGAARPSTRAGLKQPWAALDQSLPFATALADVQAACSRAAEACEHVADAAPDFLRLAERARRLKAQAEAFAEPVDDTAGRVRFVETTAHQARLVESPLDIREAIAAQRAGPPKAWVFTSATLGDDDALSWFTAGAGLEDATRLRVPSPFDYAQHARAFAPRRFPKPGEASHPQAVGALAARLAAAAGGRTFVLTTTLRVLEPIARALHQAAGGAFEILVQGREPRRALLARFGHGEGVVLVGSASFWEGIDIPGDALQCVVIDKLPFPPPNDPLVQAKVRRLEAAGASAFDAFFVAEAAVSLKQGAGRLIRSETDRGLLVIADPRLPTQRYGARLKRALPPFGWLDEEAQALAWLRALREPAPPAWPRVPALPLEAG
jgi:ATP-dependent DNA helicase DinG